MTTAWKGHLTLGDLGIAVHLTHGPKASESGLKNIHVGCGSPVGVKDYCKATKRTVRKDAIGKAGEFEGRLIPLPAAELAAIAPADTLTLPLDLTNHVDPLFYLDAYFVHPEATAEPDYAALRELLQQEDVVAISKIALSRERFLVIRPGEKGLIAHTIYYAQESRSLDEFRCSPAPMDRLQAFRAAAIPILENACPDGFEPGKRLNNFDPRATTDPYPPTLYGLIKRLAEAPPKKTAARATKVKKAA